MLLQKRHQVEAENKQKYFILKDLVDWLRYRLVLSLLLEKREKSKFHSKKSLNEMNLTTLHV